MKLEKMSAPLVLYVFIYRNHIYDYQKFLETEMKAIVGCKICPLRNSEMVTSYL